MWKNILTIVFCMSFSLITFNNSVAQSKNDSSTSIGQKLLIGQMLLLRLGTNTKFGQIDFEDQLGNISINDLYFETPIGPIRANELTISNLEGFDKEALRFGGQLSFHGISYDISQGGLPNEFISAARSADFKKFYGDLTVEFEYEIGQSELSFSIFISTQKAGDIIIEANVTDLYLKDSNDIFKDVIRSGIIEIVPPEIRLNAKLEHLFISFEDHGFVNKVINYIASSEDMKTAQVQRKLASEFGRNIESILKSDQISPDRIKFIEQFIRDVSVVFRKFILSPNYLEVSIAPDEAINFEELGSIITAGDIDLLNIQTSRFRGEGDGRKILAKADVELLLKSQEGRIELGRRYLMGDGVPQNFPKALKVLNNARSSDDPNLLYLLALVNQRGLGVDKNVTNGYGFALLSAALGDGRAARILNSIESQIPQKNLSTEQAKTFKRWEKSKNISFYNQRKSAAISGDIGAMRQLSRSFLKGVNVPRNYVKAYVWASVAAAAGDGMSRSIRDSLLAFEQSSKLSIEDLRSAQSLSENLWSSISIEMKKKSE